MARSRPKRKKETHPVAEDSKGNDENVVNNEQSSPSSLIDEDTKPFTFTQPSQTTFELSQSLPAVNDLERLRLQNLNNTATSSVICDLSRLILFKAMANEPIDRLKCINAAATLKEIKDHRVSNALFAEAAKRLLNVFGFDIRSVPDFMKVGADLGSRFKNRYYVINKVIDIDGTHSRRMHENEQSSEKGILMVVLAFAFCKGSPSKHKGSHTMRWIAGDQLYDLLHMVDENIPGEPPGERDRRKSGATMAKKELDIDSLLEKFVQADYLLKDFFPVNGVDGEENVMYAMGPRAALEIGRRQLVYFCAQVLDEDPDPTILAEIEDEFDSQHDSEKEGDD
eukprot:CAMPEP_0172500324 /NCGR_PEP_ID=MMETSP1066-20121228/136958_1 /TAXON_ID=671091 /ORGANISM="Coscinodiscus wailesii, Strain CCMP2513" /LENGTH=338 /DNA_ID=CAMNT_0013274501 /DNA_START=111 /DNA_END=1127 /DNA_ORIENTATION=-